jgi:hypothetical protein
VRVQVHFYTRDLNLSPIHTEPSLGAGFIFHPRVHPKPERNLKKKTQNPKTPERNIFTKPDGHLNLTKNPMSSHDKFNPTIFFYGSDFLSTQSDHP